jgi:hypothetical protein
VWCADTEDFREGTRFRVLLDGTNVSFRELFRSLEDDPDFAHWYTALLAAVPLEAFFWEHPPVSTANFDDTAEFMLLDGPALARLGADPEPFRSQFERHAGQSVATFRNLGGDAVLVAPLPAGRQETYAHLAAFLRNAPDTQVAGFWRQTAKAVRENIGEEPMWISTAGMGVAWLHIRLDSRPKYYRFGPYRSIC